MHEIISNEIQSTIAVMNQILQSRDLINTIHELALHCANSIKNHNKILFAGNGGSAADSQHLAAELVSRLSYNRPAMPSIALTTDTSALTAIGNDYGYENVFSRQIEAIARPGDVLFVITTSGKSPNIIKAAKTAKSLGITLVSMTGANKTELHDLCDFNICIPSTITPKIQECHITLGHIICSLIEEEIYGKDYNPQNAKLSAAC